MGINLLTGRVHMDKHNTTISKERQDFETLSLRLASLEAQGYEFHLIAARGIHKIGVKHPDKGFIGSKKFSWPTFVESLTELIARLEERGTDNGIFQENRD